MTSLKGSKDKKVMGRNKYNQILDSAQANLDVSNPSHVIWKVKCIVYIGKCNYY